MSRSVIFIMGALLVVSPNLNATVVATPVTMDAAADRWMYPFNASPGTRSLAPTFFDGQDTDFDNRDGQFFVGFDTATAGVQAGLPAGSYQIVSATVRATHFQGTFEYDPTYDSYQTYDGSLADADTGRAIELYGAGFRNTFTHGEFSPGVPGPPGFEEDDAFGVGGPTSSGVRNAFPIDLVNGDVSNNIDGGFEALPLAVGQSTSGLSPGDPVPEGEGGVSPGETFAFAIDLGHPEVVAYLQQGLSAGGLFFTITSLHGAAEQQGGMNPNFYTTNNFDPAAIPPSLTLEVNVIPEPQSLFLLLAGVAMWIWMPRRRARLANME